MDHFNKLHRQVYARIATGVFMASALPLVGFWVLNEYTSLSSIVLLGISLVVALCSSLLAANILTGQTLAPLQTIWQAILHIDPDHHSTPAPNLDNLHLGRELVNKLVLQVYQFASQQNSKELVEHRRQISQAANIVTHLPLPLFVFNKQQLVTNASNSALEYCNIESSQLFGQSLFDNLHLEFPSEYTLDAWVQSCQDNKVTDTAYWERVHVLSKDDNSLIRQCDIAAYYNKDNPSGTEFIVTLFDRTERYGQDDESLSFVALAVHELRTPITMLRGYIEVFEEELSGKLDDELQSFMLKMDSAAKHLSSFVGNILNVARIEQNQLSLHLVEADWAEVVTSSTQDAQLRAKIQAKTITFDIASELPAVAVDVVSMYEIMNNLLENAIKYSGQSKEIIFKSVLNNDNMIETTIQDFGAGIPNNILPNLFEKFSRNHRTSSQVSGTGLGLYLSKAIITAHGGQIWASSKEGKGSTFGFTLQPYSALSAEQKNSTNKEITRSANGWIKNHSLYRR